MKRICAVVFPLSLLRIKVYPCVVPQVLIAWVVAFNVCNWSGNVQAPFNTKEGEWETIDLNFSAFVAVRITPHVLLTLCRWRVQAWKFWCME